MKLKYSHNYLLYLALLILIIISTIIFGHQKLGEEYYLSNTKGYSYSTVKLSDQNVFKVKIANTPSLQKKGLSGTTALRSDQGMIFISKQSSLQCFWMKDMKYNIDILWFDKDKKITHYEKSVSPESYPKTYCSDTPSPYVIELSSGIIDRYNIKIGDYFVGITNSEYLEL